jgi:hypothetical protein
MSVLSERRVRAIVALVGLLAVPGACSASGGSDSAGGGSGGRGTGGGGAGGVINAQDIKIVGSVTQCPGTTPTLPAGEIPACTSQTCQAAHCVPTNQVPPGTDTTLLGPCSGGLCVPDDYIATYGQFQTKVCESIDGAEGRCISTCIPSVAAQLDRLPPADCATTERCAPCYSPIDGTDTGACTQGCDQGPTQPKYQFASCGGGAGLCVPKSLVPADLQAAVPVESCTQPDHVCAPTEKVKDINYNFPACTPSNPIAAGAQPGPNGQKGGCVPKYLVTDPIQLTVLLQDTCQVNELCAPCTNPLSNNAPTGACPTQ